MILYLLSIMCILITHKLCIIENEFMSVHQMKNLHELWNIHECGSYDHEVYMNHMLKHKM